MSHHRETVTADPGPPAAGPYSHAVKSNGLLFLSGQVHLDPDTGQLVERHARRPGRGAAWTTSTIVAEAAGAKLEDAVRIAVYVTDISVVRGDQRGLRRATSRPTRPRAPRSASPRCRWAPRSRWTRSSPSDERHRRRDVDAPHERRSRPSRAARRCCPPARSPSARAGRSCSRRRTCSAPARSRSAASAAKLAALGDEGCAHGVVAASARQPRPGARRRRARSAASPCEVFVPADAPMAKVEAARGQGAIVHVGGDSVDACLVAALRARRDAAGWRSCTRSTTRRSSPARARSGSSCSRTCPTSRKVVIPVGGGGLCAGIALAIKAARPEVRDRRRAGRRVRAVPGVAAARRADRGRRRR